MENVIMAVISKITKISVENLSNNKDKNNLWDSMHHVEVIFALEEEFGIEYTQDEIGQMKNVEKLLEITKQRIKKKDIF